MYLVVSLLPEIYLTRARRHQITTYLTTSQHMTQRFAAVAIMLSAQDHLTVWPTLSPIWIRDMRKSLMERFTPVYRDGKRYAGKDLWRHLHCDYDSPDPSLTVVLCPLSVSTPDGITATCGLTSIPVKIYRNTSWKLMVGT